LTFSLDFLKVDSEVFGLSTWNLTGIESSQDFYLAIKSLKRDQSSHYITCKLPIEDVQLIHAAESAGFNFLETQFQTTLRLKKTFDTSKYSYEYVLIRSQDQLHEILKMAETTIEHDRFSRDPKIGRNASGLRYCRYLEDSFYRDGDEIWAVQSKATGKLLTFRSHRIHSRDEVILLLGGVHPDFKNLGLGIVSSHFCFNQLRDAGFHRATTHISAANSPILNLEVGHFDFRIGNTFVVMRAVLG
jgi:hypothetical protein